MDTLEKYKIKVSKRTLLLLAGIVWSFAGSRIFSLGYNDLILSTDRPWGYLIISVLIFFAFYKFVFRKMVRKHTTRIMTSGLLDHCIFSFFDFKGYIIMGFMIAGGITLRNAHVINPVFLGTFYIGLSSALLLAGIKFLVSFLNIKRLNYINEK